MGKGREPLGRRYRCMLGVGMNLGELCLLLGMGEFQMHNDAFG